jgi:hypothetical protein
VQFWTSEIEKQVGARVQIVLETPELLLAYQRFGAEILRRSSVFHGLERFLRANDISGDRCFEIGTWNGLTAVVLSKFFRQVVSVDIAHNALKRSVLEHVGVRNVTCIDIRDNFHKRQVAESLAFDFAYLDGDHANDTADDWELTNRCGRVLFHECWPWQQPVWELVHALPRREVVLGGMGLALWRRSGAA